VRGKSIAPEICEYAKQERATRVSVNRAALERLSADKGWLYSMKTGSSTTRRACRIRSRKRCGQHGRQALCESAQVFCHPSSTPSSNDSESALSRG
jgi:hypothetical protein